MAKSLADSAAIRAFFAWSDRLEHDVLRPLSHVRANWELSWDAKSQRYETEDDSYASDLNDLIDELAQTPPTPRYHDNEDALAEYVIAKLKWPIAKVNGRWIGVHYSSILEQGGFGDIDQQDLLAAAAGRIHAAIRFGQHHFDDMERSHRHMLAAVLSIIFYHRTK